MNLLCPNCQKPLSVPEQYAGQPMRCPLCAGTFTVPALPQSPAPPPPPTAAPSPPPQEPQLAPTPPADVYGFRDPVAPPAPTPVNPPAAPAPSSAPPEFDLQVMPAAPGAPPRTPAAPQTPYVEGQPTYPVTPPPEGYHRKLSAWFSPKVLQYVAPGCVVLIFILTFFAWTGIYPGGVAATTQNAWQAMFGYHTDDPDMPKIITYEDKFKDDDKDKPEEEKRIDDRPGINILLIFYFILFLPTLLITLACLASSFMPPAQLPTVLHSILPWRWGIVAALNLLVLLFLVLQMLLGFSLENRWLGAKDTELNREEKARVKLEGKALTTSEARELAVQRGVDHQAVSRTIWLDLVVLFHLLAVLGAAAMFWVLRRGARPAPRIDLLT
jgi:hypothetical protein